MKKPEKKNDPFKILGVKRTSTEEEINKAYTKLRLKYHPDRKTGNREMYDQIVEAYNQIQHCPPPQYIEVDSFIKKYKDSEDEIKDLVALYTKHKGDLTKIINHHILCEDDDEKRIRKILDSVVESKGLPKFKRYEIKVKSNPKRQAKRQREASKAEKIAKDLGVDLSQTLEEILNRSESRQKKFLEDLETKYCKRLE